MLADFACFLAYQPRLESCYNSDMKRSILLTLLTSLSLIAAVVSISQASSIGPIGPTEPPSPNKIAGWVMEEGQRVALTCFELLPHQCHRHCVSDALQKIFGPKLAAHHI